LRRLRLPLPKHSGSPSPGQQYFPLARRLIACAALCQALGACAVTTPFGEGVDSQPTGLISAAPQPPKPAALPASLDDEDRRRAMGALSIALDPQGNGAPVRWDNPVSKAHGQVTPIGFAFPSKDVVCRKFSAQFETRVGSRTDQGSACRDKNADWTIAELRPAKAE
jgi:surface antigen